MAKKEKKSKAKREIRNLLLVLVAAVAVGGVAVAVVAKGVVGGSYVGKHVLLAPDILTGTKTLADIDPESRLQRSWVFSQVDYYARDPSRGTVNCYHVEPAAYAGFYGRLADAKSIPGDELDGQFLGPDVRTLVLTLKPTGRYAASYRPNQFLKVEFAPKGDLVRVQLHEKGAPWAYFRAPGLGYETHRAFVGVSG